MFISYIYGTHVVTGTAIAAGAVTTTLSYDIYHTTMQMVAVIRLANPARVLSCLKTEVVAEDRSTSAETSSEHRGEDQFESWAAQAGIKAPKLRHEVFKDSIVGELR